MKRNLMQLIFYALATTSIIVPIVILTVEARKGAPQFEYYEQQVAETFEVVTETETSIEYSLEMYIHKKAEEQNALLEQKREELLMMSEQTTEAPTEEEFVPFKSIPLDAEFQLKIKELCDIYEFDYTFLIGWMWTESRCRWVIGSHNDTGYMQIIPEYWEGYNGLNLYDPLENVEMALAIINRNLEINNGDIYCALQQYNTGKGSTRNGYADLVYQNVEYIRSLEEQ